MVRQASKELCVARHGRSSSGPTARLLLLTIAPFFVLSLFPFAYLRAIGDKGGGINDLEFVDTMHMDNQSAGLPGEAGRPAVYKVHETGPQSYFEDGSKEFNPLPTSSDRVSNRLGTRSGLTVESITTMLPDPSGLVSESAEHYGGIGGTHSFRMLFGVEYSQGGYLDDDCTGAIGHPPTEYTCLNRGYFTALLDKEILMRISDERYYLANGDYRAPTRADYTMRLTSVGGIRANFVYAQETETSYYLASGSKTSTIPFKVTNPGHDLGTGTQTLGLNVYNLRGMYLQGGGESIGDYFYVSPGNENFKFEGRNIVLGPVNYGISVDPGDFEQYTVTVTHGDLGDQSACNRVLFKPKDGVQSSMTYNRSGGCTTTTPSATIKGAEIWCEMFLSGSNVNVVPVVPSLYNLVRIRANPGTYYFGQTVPIEVELSTYIKDYTAYLTINGTRYEAGVAPMRNGNKTNKSTVISRFLVFYYPIKFIDSAYVTVTNLEIIRASNALGESIAQGDLSITDSNTDVTAGIIQAPKKTDAFQPYKAFSFNPSMTGLYTMVSISAAQLYDSAGGKTLTENDVTEVQRWLLSEAIYDTEQAKYFIPSLFVSSDGGRKNRFPFYINMDETEQYVTNLVAFYNAPPTSFYGGYRYDVVEVFMDKAMPCETNYMELNDAGTDFKHAAPSRFSSPNSTEQTGCPGDGSRSIYRVPPPVMFGDSNVTIIYGEDWMRYANQTTSVGTAFVELINEESDGVLTLSYDFDRSAGFTFSGPDKFKWVSGNESLATIEGIIDSGAGIKRATITPTGKTGTCHFNLVAFNSMSDGGDRSYSYRTASFTFKIGEKPFISIPKATTTKLVKYNTATSFSFTSNLTEKNWMTFDTAHLGDGSTTFTFKVYKCATSGCNAKTNPVVHSETAVSTIDNTVGYLSIPDGLLNVLVPGGPSYMVTISAVFFDKQETMTATGYIKLIPQPPVINVKKIFGNSFVDDTEATVSWQIDMLDRVSGTAEWLYTIKKDGDADPIYKGSYKGRGLRTSGFAVVSMTVRDKLKEKCTLEIRARNSPEEEWSADSYVFSVYNSEALKVILAPDVDNESSSITEGHIRLSNTAHVPGMLDTDGRRVIIGGSKKSLDELRKYLSLSAFISTNGSEYAWSRLNDQFAWRSSDSSVAMVNFKRGGFYSNIEAYSISSYYADDMFLLVGRKTGDASITVTHTRAAGMQRVVEVSVETLKNKIYLFSVLPKQATMTVYTNGAGERVEVQTDANGELGVYEPSGIASDVSFKTTVNGEEWIGKILNASLGSAEQDKAALRVYPVNASRLKSASKISLIAVASDGSVLRNKSLELRGGVYNNGGYCKNTAFVDSVNKGGPDTYVSGRLTHTYTTNSEGKMILFFTPDSLTLGADYDLRPDDVLDYVFEVQADGYYPAIARVSSSVKKGLDSIVLKAILRPLRGVKNTPFILSQFFMNANSSFDPVTGDIIDGIDLVTATGNVGPSNKFVEVKIITDTVVWGAQTAPDPDTGFNTVTDGQVSAYFEDTNKVKPDGQVGTSTPVVVTNLGFLPTAVLYTYPFSSFPHLKCSYTMNATTMGATVTPSGNNWENAWLKPKGSINVSFVFYDAGKVLLTTRMGFSIANMLDVEEPTVIMKSMGEDVKKDLKEGADIGSIFEALDGGTMLGTALTFFSSLASGGSLAIEFRVFPTEDPYFFRNVVKIGQFDGGDEGDGVSVNYSDENSMKAIADAINEGSDGDNNEDNGGGGWEFKLHGILRMSSTYDPKTDKWNNIMTGGTIGAKVEVSKEYTQNYMCGPIPATISFGASLGASIEVGFESIRKDDGTYVDTMAKVGLEAGVSAFVGVGFDLSIIALKFGISGELSVGAEFTILNSEYLPTQGKGDFYMGANFTIKGQIGLKFYVKILFISYSTTFASVGFSKSYAWRDYDFIVSYWDGITGEGSTYSAVRYASGGVMYAIDSTTPADRSYLTRYNREWLSVAALEESSIAVLQTNSNPDSTPKFSEDGRVIVYVSDGDSADVSVNTIAYAVFNRATRTYDILGTIPDASNLPGTQKPDFGKTSLSAGGRVYTYEGEGGTRVETPCFFAAWVAQTEEAQRETYAYSVDGEGNIVKEPTQRPTDGGQASDSDIEVMLSSSEIFYSVAFSFGSGGKPVWTQAVRVTNNTMGDIAPSITGTCIRQTNGTCALHSLLVWRTVAGSSSADPYNFDVLDTLSYAWVDGTTLKKGVSALYNGSQGGVLSVDTAMMSDGTAIVAFVVKTQKVRDFVVTEEEEEGTTNATYMNETEEGTVVEEEEEDTFKGSEVFVSVISVNGSVIRTVRLTSNEDTDENAKVAVVRRTDEVSGTSYEEFVVAWYSDHPNKEGEMVKDILFSAVRADGTVDDVFVDGIYKDTHLSVSSNFDLVIPPGGSLADLVVMWATEVNGMDLQEGEEQHYIFQATKFYQSRAGDIGLMNPKTVASLGFGIAVDNFTAYGDEDGAYNIIISGSDYSEGMTELAGTITPSQDAPSEEEAIAIFSKDPVAKMILLSVEFEDSFTVGAKCDTTSLQMGFDLSITLAITNTGSTPLVAFKVTVDGVEETVGVEDGEGVLEVLPDAVYNHVFTKTIGEDAVEDISYSVVGYLEYNSISTIEVGEEVSGTILLNRPGVSISRMGVTSEQDGVRLIKVELDNETNVSLRGSGKEVVVSFHNSPSQTAGSLIGSVVVGDSEGLYLIDLDVYSCQTEVDVVDLVLAQYTLSELEEDEELGWKFGPATYTKPTENEEEEGEGEELSEIYYQTTYEERMDEEGNTIAVPVYHPVTKVGEIPAKGLTVYAEASILNGDGSVLQLRDTITNHASVSFGGLLAKNKGESLLISSDISRSESKTLTTLHIQNNSLGKREFGAVKVYYLDEEQRRLAVGDTYAFTNKHLLLTREARQDIEMEMDMDTLPVQPSDLRFRTIAAENTIHFRLRSDMDFAVPPEDQEIIYGDTVDRPVFEHEFLEIRDWYWDAELAKIFDFSTDLIDEETTIHAKVVYKHPVVTVVSSNVNDVYGNGKTHSLTVTGMCDDPMYYQWYNGDNLIAGATDPDLIVSGVADTGTYHCVVSATIEGLHKETRSADITVAIRSDVRFDLGEMTTENVAPQEIPLGGLVVKPTDPADTTTHLFRGWVDEVGKPFDFQHPVADDSITIHAVWLFRKIVVTSQPTGMTKVYDGLAHSMTFGVAHPATLLHQWYRLNEASNKWVVITGATDSTLAVRDVVDSGTYRCVATATDGTDTTDATSETAVVGITKAPLAISADSKTAMYGEAVQLTYTITGFVNGEGEESLVGKVLVVTDSILNAGDTPHIIQVGGVSSPNYSIAYAEGGLQITKRHITITAASCSKLYDGTEIRCETHSTSGDGFVDGEGLAGVTVVGGQLFVGLCSNVIGGYHLKSNTLAANYTITTQSGTVEVTRASIPITIAVGSKLKMYDSSPLTCNTHTLTGTLAHGDSVSVEYSGSITEIGETANTISAHSVVHNDGTDVSENYQITVTGGTLTVTKRAVYITVDSKSVMEGDEETPLTYTITQGSFIGEDASTITLSRDAGNAPGFYTIRGVFQSPNYLVVWVTGIYTIRRRSIEVAEGSSPDVSVFSSSGLNPRYAASVERLEPREFRKVDVGVNRVIKQIYNIKLLDEGVEVQPDRDVTITLSLDEEVAGSEDIGVVFISEHGQATRLAFAREDNTAAVTVGHLSIYAITDIDFKRGNIAASVVAPCAFILILVVMVGLILRARKNETRAARPLVVLADFVVCVFTCNHCARRRSAAKQAELEEAGGQGEAEQTEKDEESVKQLPDSTSSSGSSASTPDTQETVDEMSVDVSACIANNDEEDFGVFPDEMPDTEDLAGDAGSSSSDSASLSVVTETGPI